MLSSPTDRSRDLLPPHCPEAERGVLGCCLLDIRKAVAALKAGINSRWFYDARHAQIFSVLSDMGSNGGGDLLVATLRLRERGKLDAIGGVAYLNELQNAVPSAENLDFYIPDLQDHFRRRQILDITGRLNLLAYDPTANSAQVLADTATVLEVLHRQADTNALPEIICAEDLLATEMADPPELIAGVLHQGSKLIVGGSSKSYKTWTLADLAISVASGSPWLGFDTVAGKVLYINLEIQAGFFRRRVAELLRVEQVELQRRLEIWNLRGCAADYQVLIPKIRTRIRDAGHALVIIDPTYKLLGGADENSATDISALLNAVENLAVTTGAAVAMAGHFAKGNAAAKDTIDRISGSGVFARDPDSLITFTKHEEEGAFTVDLVLRNLPPVEPFVVKWDWPLFKRAQDLDPAKLKQTGGRPAKHTAEMLLKCLHNKRLRTTEWKQAALDEFGIPKTRFFALMAQLETEKKVCKSAIDEKWEEFEERSRNSNHEKDQ